MPILAQSQLPISTKDILSWCDENRGTFDQNAPIYIDTATGNSISANQAWVYIRKLIAGFRALGVKKGDSVCIHAFNNLFYPILVQGIIGTGATFLGTNPAYTTYELEHTLRISKAKYIITDTELLKAPKAAAKAVDIPASNILLLSNVSDGEHASWRSLLNHGFEDWISFDDEHTARTTNAFLLFSSGTTGLPKAAQLSHYNLIAEHTLVHENPSHQPDFPLSLLVSLPMFHAAMAPVTHTTALRSGCPAHIMRRFEPWAYLSAIERFKTTRIMCVPPMVIALLACARQDEARVRKSLQSVRTAIAGAAPMSAETQNKFQRLLPQGTPFTQLWAMSETSCVATYSYPSQFDSTGSVGRPLPCIDLKLVDVEDSEVEVGPYDVRGELCIRGPTVIRGYLDNPTANAEAYDSDGFFHTGDIAICNGKSKLWYVVDRKKELIKVRGFQVAPAEIEGVLLQHPDVADVAVIGVPSGDSGELPRAFVVKRQGSRLDESQVKAWVGNRLAKYKQLAGGIAFVDAVPKNASGKILKRLLRESIMSQEGSKL